MDASTPRLDPVPGRLAYGVTILVALCVLTPYLWTIPAANKELVTQAQTALLTGWTTILVFYFKGRADLKDQTIADQAQAAKAAQAALTPTEPAIPVEPGQRVTVEGQTS